MRRSLSTFGSTLMRNLNARKIVTFIQLNYATTNITTAAFVQLLASIPKGIAEIQIVNGSTSTLILATGTAGNAGNVAADLQTYFAAKLLEVAE